MRHLILVLMGCAAAAPAVAQISVIGSGVEEQSAQPGETYSGTVKVRNIGNAVVEARVYLTDYTFSADGRSAFDRAGSLPRSNAAWIRFTPAQLRLEPGAEGTVGYTVTVPAGAAGGSYWSALMVETADAPSGAVRRPNARAQVAIGVSTRYAVQIATTLPGAAARADFAGARAVTLDGTRGIEFDLLNGGELAYRPRLRLELYDASGSLARTIDAERGLLYPGTSLRQRFELGAVAPGEYQALITADTGGDEVFGAQYRLRL